jgi:hypothetical protein
LEFEFPELRTENLVTPPPTQAPSPKTPPKPAEGRRSKTSAALKARVPDSQSNQWLLEPTGEVGQYLKIEDGRSPDRRPKWSDLVNASEAEMIANQDAPEEIMKDVTQVMKTPQLETNQQTHNSFVPSGKR